MIDFIDFIDIFDVYQQGKIAGLGSLQADTMPDGVERQLRQ